MKTQVKMMPPKGLSISWTTDTKEININETLDKEFKRMISENPMKSKRIQRNR
jgi:hypothetical protein